MGEGFDELAALATEKRVRLLKLCLNALLFSLLLVGPYVRGYVRARTLIQKHAELAACVYGGEPSAEPGLGMPSASESYFAARLLSKSEDFPKRCVALLDALVPAPATFVFPAVKRAEADLAEVRELLRRELSALALHVPSSRIPTRPLRALDRLRAVVSEQALAGGMWEVPKGDAVDLRRARRLAVPTRVPVYAQSDARITFSGDDTELGTVAVDARGVSYVRVGRGGLDQRRTPRPKLLEAFSPLADGGAFVWAMPQSRCRERAQGCSNKSMGIALSSVPWIDLPLPRWLGAHPAGRVDRSVWLGADEVVVLAELSEGARGIRRFSLDLGERPESADMPPLSASARGQLRFVGDGLLLARAAGPTVVAFTRSEPGAKGVAAPVSLVAVSAHDDSAPVVLAAAHALKGSPWVVATECGEALRFAFGDADGFQAGELAADRPVVVFARQELAFETPLDLTDRTFDHVRVPCERAAGAESVRVLARERSGRVHAYASRPDENALHDSVIATDVRAFDALATPSGLLVAYAGVAEGAQVRVVQVDSRGNARGAAAVPAACFSPAGGLCGSPLLARVGGRIVLSAREGTDLLAVESVDEGVRFGALRGLGRTD